MRVLGTKWNRLPARGRVACIEHATHAPTSGTPVGCSSRNVEPVDSRR